MHRDRNLGVQSLSSLDCLHRVNRIHSPDGHQQEVNRTNPHGFLLGWHVPEIAQVTDPEAGDLKTENGVLAPLGAFTAIVVGCDSLEFQNLYPVRTCSFNNLGLSLKALDIIVVAMIMADQNDIGLIRNWAVANNPAEPSGLIRMVIIFTP